MNYTWNLNKFLSFSSQVLLTLVALINISCQSEIAAKFPSSMGNGTGGDNDDNVEISSGVDLTKPFIFKWRLIDDGNPETDKIVTLPLRKNFNYNFVVDWGDGSSSTITSWDDSDKTHTYPDYDEYTATISGLVEAWYFNYGFYLDGEDYIYDSNNSYKKISEVAQLGHMGWKDLEGAFAGCDKMAKFISAETDTSRVANFSMMFDSTGSQLFDVMWNPLAMDFDISTLNTANATTMESMFQATGAASLDLANFNTAKVNNMKNMFTGGNTVTLQNITITSFNTAEVTTMAGMFAGLRKIEQINFPSEFNTAKVSDMSSMFSRIAIHWNPRPAVNLDLSSFRNMSALNMQEMFLDSNIGELNISNWNIHGDALLNNLFYNPAYLGEEWYNPILPNLTCNPDPHGACETIGPYASPAE